MSATDDTTTILNEIVAAAERMPPARRKAFVREWVDRAKQLGEAFAAMPSHDQRRAEREMAAEWESLAGDLAKLPRAERARFGSTFTGLLAFASERPPADVWLAKRAERAVKTALRAGKAAGGKQTMRACRHVLAGGPLIATGGALLCAGHPRDGVRCEDCHNAHAETHDPKWELTCDRCGTVCASTIWPVHAFGAATVPVRTAQGRRRFVPGALIVAGLGLCDQCHDESPMSQESP